MLQDFETLYTHWLHKKYSKYFWDYSLFSNVSVSFLGLKYVFLWALDHYHSRFQSKRLPAYDKLPLPELPLPFISKDVKITLDSKSLSMKVMDQEGLATYACILGYIIMFVIHISLYNHVSLSTIEISSLYNHEVYTIMFLKLILGI